MDTPTAETDPLVAALDALQVLTGWDDHPADRVLEAAQAAPAQLHQALTWGGQRSVLSPLDRADLYAVWAAGERLALCGVTALEKDGAAGIEPISRECAYFAAIVCPSGGWPVDPDRERLVRRGCSPPRRLPEAHRALAGSCDHPADAAGLVEVADLRGRLAACRCAFHIRCWTHMKMRPTAPVPAP